eukprot:TRINITY_DN1582_c0_g1_i1.p1 TRINITY_DN1582_c0_g1~~TRINITY_DN1582_c0_g1_i1.p1  ORF type:complete len:333 (+),score=41.46 TRINITY_DN1582_c0_g1_i1:46-1044(+)
MMSVCPLWLIALSATTSEGSRRSHSGTRPPGLHFTPSSQTLLVPANASSAHGVVGANLRGTSAAISNNSHGLDSNSSHSVQKMKHKWPYSCEKSAAVGKVCSLYYSSLSDEQITSVEAQNEYKPASRGGVVWHGASILPEPSCALQLRPLTPSPSDTRRANFRLAELAICELLARRDPGVKHPPVPQCGATEAQVCELQVSAPLSTSDELQEPYVAAAVALAAYSKICALFSPGEEYKCQVHRGDWAVTAGLQLRDGGVVLTGFQIEGLLDLKLDYAYGLFLKDVVIAADSKPIYEQTEFHRNLPDVLKWDHTPPSVSFCDDLSCLVHKFIR